MAAKKKTKTKTKTKTKQNKTKQNKQTSKQKNNKATMRDKRVETLSFQRVFWCMLFNSYRLAQKTTPLPPNNVGFPIAQTMGFAAVQH